MRLFALDVSSWRFFPSRNLLPPCNDADYFFPSARRLLFPDPRPPVATLALCPRLCRGTVLSARAFFPFPRRTSRTYSFSISSSSMSPAPATSSWPYVGSPVPPAFSQGFFCRFFLSTCVSLTGGMLFQPKEIFLFPALVSATDAPSSFIFFPPESAGLAQVEFFL